MHEPCQRRDTRIIQGAHAQPETFIELLLHRRLAYGHLKTARHVFRNRGNPPCVFVRRRSTMGPRVLVSVSSICTLTLPTWRFISASRAASSWISASPSLAPHQQARDGVTHTELRGHLRVTAGVIRVAHQPRGVTGHFAQNWRDTAREDIASAKMHNYAAAVFAQGLAETAIMVQKLGGGLETVFSLPGAGDLYVTTQGGRNSRMGRLLGMGMSYSEAVEEMPGETIEGVDAVVAIMPAIETMIAQGKLEANALPLLRELHRIVTRNATVAFDFNSFFSKLPFNPPENIHST